MAVHNRQDRRPPPPATGSAPTRGPRKRVDTHVSRPLCGASSIAAAAQNTHVGFFVLLSALCFIQALFGTYLSIFVTTGVMSLSASRPPVSAKLNTDVAAASPLTAKATARCQRASAVSNVWPREPVSLELGVLGLHYGTGMAC
ncbi:hypothetical protein C8R45DRAFT_1090275 [Mycena sanguinolenta]|nr:hypothetical protein C8R45DRAFT_1090275 [Mycena sanguinolenta]